NTIGLSYDRAAWRARDLSRILSAWDHRSRQARREDTGSAPGAVPCHGAKGTHEPPGDAQAANRRTRAAAGDRARRMECRARQAARRLRCDQRIGCACEGEASAYVPLFVPAVGTGTIFAAVCMWPSQRLALGAAMPNWSSTRMTMWLTTSSTDCGLL